MNNVHVALRETDGILDPSPFEIVMTTDMNGRGSSFPRSGMLRIELPDGDSLYVYNADYGHKLKLKDEYIAELERAVADRERTIEKVEDIVSDLQESLVELEDIVS